MTRRLRGGTKLRRDFTQGSYWVAAPKAVDVAGEMAEDAVNTGLDEGDAEVSDEPLCGPVRPVSRSLLRGPKE